MLAMDGATATAPSSSSDTNNAVAEGPLTNMASPAPAPAPASPERTEKSSEDTPTRAHDEDEEEGGPTSPHQETPEETAEAAKLDTAMIRAESTALSPQTDLFDPVLLDAARDVPEHLDKTFVLPYPSTRGGKKPSLKSRVLATFQPLLFILAGPICSILAIGLARSADAATEAFRNLVIVYTWSGVLITPSVFAFVAWFTNRWARGSHASGIPQTILAMKRLGVYDAQERAHRILEDAGLEKPPESRTVAIPPRARTWSDWFSGRPVLEYLVSPRILLWKFVGTVTMIAGGAVGGREGPTAQIAASVSHVIASLAHFSVAAHRSAILAGTAAGIAAAFTTPIGGILFSIEELSRVYTDLDKLIIPSTVAISGLVAKMMQQDALYYGRVSVSYNDGADNFEPELFFTIILFAVLAGWLGGVWARITVEVNKYLALSDSRFAKMHRDKPYVVAGMCGMAIALLGFIPGQYAYGPGYTFARQLIQTAAAAPVGVPNVFTSLPNSLVYGLFPLKFIGCFLTFTSTGPSGIFAPSMAAGTGLGSLFGILCSSYMLSNWHVNPTLPIQLTSTAAYFSAVTQSPLTATVILLEAMSLDGTWILPMLSAALVGSYAGKIFASPWPIYEKLSDIALEAAEKRRQNEQKGPTDDEGGEDEAQKQVTPDGPAAPPPLSRPEMKRIESETRETLMQGLGF